MVIVISRKGVVLTGCWLILHKYQRAYAIKNCPSCVIIVVVQCHHLWMLLLLRNLMTETWNLADICRCYPSICTWILSQYDIHFLNGSHFFFTCLLPKWSIIKASQLIQMCIYFILDLRTWKEAGHYDLYSVIYGHF